MVGRGAETTATFRCKALFLCVRALKGRQGANTFIQAVGAGRVFEDETKPISRELWLRALREFEELVGDEGFSRLSRYLVHPENLGAWSFLLRGAHDPGDIYAKLDEAGGEQDYGWTWRGPHQEPFEWSGEICFLESDDADSRRRIELALEAELKAVPLLFGLAQAHVSRHEESPGDHGCANQVVQEVVWKPASIVTIRTGLISGLALAGAAGVAARLIGLSEQQSIFIGVSALILCGAGTFVLARDSQHRTTGRAQQVRIMALEREASLQKLLVKEISRPHEEPVIAGKYRLAEQLGAGASGSVWKAKRLTDGHSVAIKLLRTALAQDPRATDRLRREAQALGLSWHPHVVEVLDDGILSSGVAFLVTELLEGQTLAQRVQTGGAMNRLTVAELGVQAADALMAIHGAGVIHRDVKPDNLFLHQTKGGTERLKLIDFGVAAVSWAETRLTRHGARVGTRGYAAPEQEDGSDLDERADLFGLGQSLKEALSGEAPHVDESREARSLLGLPGGWSEVLNRLTATVPDDRYASSRDAREALRKLVEEETVKSA